MKKILSKIIALIIIVLILWILNKTGIMSINIGPLENILEKIWGNNQSGAVEVLTGNANTGAVEVFDGNCESGYIVGISGGVETCVPVIVNSVLNCISPDGRQILDGEKTTLYAYDNNRCISKIFTCKQGEFAIVGIDPSTLSGYIYASCGNYKNTSSGSCISPRGAIYANGSKFLAFEKDIVNKDQDCSYAELLCQDGNIDNPMNYSYNNCRHAEDWSINFVSQNPNLFSGSSKSLENLDIDNNKKSCKIFGQTIKHGQVMYFFQNEKVNIGEQCRYELKTCNDGTMTSSTMGYTYQSCKIGEGKTCNIAGKTIKHGESIELYSDYDKGTKDCDQQIRTCNNGVLEGDDIYKNISCKNTNINNTGTSTSIANKNNCPNPYIGENKILQPGWKGVGYYKSNVGWSEDCSTAIVGGVANMVNISCEYGTIKPIGNTTKLYRTCSNGKPVSCSTPRGEKVNHGSSTLAYSNDTASFGKTCISEARVCNNGVLGGSYKYKSCSVSGPQSCVSPRGTNIGHESSITAYQSSSVSYNSTCKSETRTCNNGVLGGSYTYQSCNISQPKSCNTTWGTVAHGKTITKATAAKRLGDEQEGKAECSRYSAKCNDGNMEGNLLSHPEAIYNTCSFQ